MLDTNILIYIRQNRPPAVLARFRTLPAGSTGMSVITFGELSFGVSKSGDPNAREALLQLSRIIPVVPLSENVGEHYGDLRASLQKSGEVIGNNDLWIAAHARSLDLVLVTNNLREFQRVPGLKLENWAA